MKKSLLAAVGVAVGVTMVGCSNWSISKTKPEVATDLAADRDERMSAAAGDLRAKGYSEARANQVAAQQVPVAETTYTESLWSVLSGEAEKKKKADEEFAKALSRP